MLDPSGGKRIEKIEDMLLKIIEALDRIEREQQQIAEMLQEIIDEAENGDGLSG